MSLETYADSATFQAQGLPPAASVRCPCCGKQRSADSIVRVDSSIGARAQARFSRPAAPEYMCTAALATLTRERIVTKAELPNRRRP